MNLTRLKRQYSEPLAVSSLIYEPVKWLSLNINEMYTVRMMKTRKYRTHATVLYTPSSKIRTQIVAKLVKTSSLLVVTYWLFRLNLLLKNRWISEAEKVIYNPINLKIKSKPFLFNFEFKFD